MGGLNKEDPSVNIPFLEVKKVLGEIVSTLLPVFPPLQRSPFGVSSVEVAFYSFFSHLPFVVSSPSAFLQSYSVADLVTVYKFATPLEKNQNFFLC